MRSWPAPAVPQLPGRGNPLRLHDSATQALVDVRPSAGPFRMYVCGVTPYDSTHLGHAATYVTFDIVQRVMRDAGYAVHYAQNVTDVDDPLLERAVRDGRDWREVAEDGVRLFRDDMNALGVLPPDHFDGVAESIDAILASIAALADRGATYPVPTADGADLYLDLGQIESFGTVFGLDPRTMIELSAERGGDPWRSGKRQPLDPLLWRAHREGEPSWPSERFGAGRPGWHIECTTLALDALGPAFDVQGGGEDLIFPHHEMSAAQAAALDDGQDPFARAYVHQGLVAYQGEKMSKSRGNLVFVSGLRRDGVEGAVIRLILSNHHYRVPWEYTSASLARAQDRYDRWRQALSVNTAPPAEATLAELRAALAADLDTPAALRAVDTWAQATLTTGGDDPAAPGIIARALDALLGIRL